MELSHRPPITSSEKLLREKERKRVRVCVCVYTRTCAYTDEALKADTIRRNLANMIIRRLDHVRRCLRPSRRFTVASRQFSREKLFSRKGPQRKRNFNSDTHTHTQAIGAGEKADLFHVAGLTLISRGSPPARRIPCLKYLCVFR